LSSVFSNIFEEKKCESFIERKRYFSSSAFQNEIEIHIIVGQRMIENEINFVLNGNANENATEISKRQMFWSDKSDNENETEDENRVSEMNEI
jgi:hypothetical protein